MRNTMQRVVTFVFACVAWSISAWAYIDAVTVLPRAPTTASDIVIHIEGGLPDPCWSLRCHTIEIAGGTITIAAQAEFSGGMCMPVIVPYAYLAQIGQLDAGTYTVEVGDNWDRATVSFEVVPRTKSIPGDANNDGTLNIADAVFVLGHLFAGGPAPSCKDLANSNGDATLNIADAIWLLTHLFASGPAPVGSIQCALARDCAGQSWLINCLGHWECVCGECRATCDSAGCGDGYCDLAGGETAVNCPDCRSAACRPVCLFIGTRSEGWYDPCTDTGDKPGLIRWAFCGDCRAECRNCGSKSEGWYDSCTGELIEYADCDCECR